MRDKIDARFIPRSFDILTPADVQALVDSQYESDQMLLYGLMFNSVSVGTTKVVVDRLLQKYGSFARVISAPTRELSQFGGLTNSDVLSLKSVYVAAIRLIRSDLDGRSIIGNGKLLSEYLIAVLSRESREQFRTLYLDAKNHLIADEIQGTGTVDHVIIYSREIIKRALELNATALILVHNHPSGDPAPSRADLELTDKLHKTASHLSIELHDHVIVGNGCIVSLRALGWLPSSLDEK